MRIIKWTPQTRQQVLQELKQRGMGRTGEYEKVVAEIVNTVRTAGDAGLFRYTREFDHCELNAATVKVTAAEITRAYEETDPELAAVMRRSAANITAFHQKQRPQSWFDTAADGAILGQRITPVDRSGIYVPGGKAAYPSSVLMNVIPAKVAGVPQIIMTTPPDRNGHINPATLVAADIGGVDEIYKAGGAQAVAAMAFGTASIPKVDKITGPGNIYVALAKKACFGHVSIDSIAGPSEILILADETANPRFVAADLLSQAEHDEMASAILLTASARLAEAVAAEIEQFIAGLSRSAIIRESLDRFGYIILTDELTAAIDAANEIASEHVEIMTREPFAIMPQIRHAGAIFLGPYSSEPLGDYYAGPNHILPTNGTARFFSPLSVDDFMKKTSIIAYTEEALRTVHRDIEFFAKNEGLTAHANSIKVRFEAKNQ